MTADSACQRLALGRDRSKGARVLTLGGANVEHGYALPGELEADSKYTIDPQPRLAGGSSVNHACRLLAMGFDVHPVLPLAKADPLGQVIVEALEAAARRGGARYRRTDLHVRGAGLLTPFTTILRQAGSRAVLNEFSPDMMLAYEQHVDRHLSRLAAGRGRPSVAMVGHAHASGPRGGGGGVGFAGEITERLLTDPALSEVRTFVNFGSAQYKQGTRRWGRVLRDHVEVFQLDIREVRRFCRDAGLADVSLASVLSWFRDRCDVVVSLERFGAIGQLAGSDRPVAAWPYLIEDVADSTGAGDAMGAGIVASMAIGSFEDTGQSDEVRREQFEAALAFGGVCAAYACTTVGGATACPDLEALAEFERTSRMSSRGGSSSQVVTDHDLFLIDRAFDG